MLSRLKKHWREFEHGKPGRRFRDRYERKKDFLRHQPNYRWFLTIASGLLLTGIGFIMMFTPGPGIPFILFGASVLAGVSCRLSRFFDWSELHIRRVGAALWRWWNLTSIPARAFIIFVGVLGTSGAAYLAYRVVT